MSSNYPPGVSGNEPQIRGALSEFTVARYCTEESVSYVPAFIVTDVLAQFGAVIVTAREGYFNEQVMRQWLTGIEELLSRHISEFACDWEGDVDVQLWDGGIITWTCPRCGTEHEDDYGEELRADPDEV